MSRVLTVTVFLEFEVLVIRVTWVWYCLLKRSMCLSVELGMVNLSGTLVWFDVLVESSGMQLLMLCCANRWVACSWLMLIGSVEVYEFLIKKRLL